MFCVIQKSEKSDKVVADQLYVLYVFFAVVHAPFTAPTNAKRAQNVSI